MSSAHEMQENQSFKIRLSNFLQKNRRLFLYFFIGVAVVLVGIAVFVQVRQYVTIKSTRMAESAQASYETWMSAETEKKAELETALRDQLGAILKKYPSSYAAQRAFFIRGALEAEKENWEPAAADFSALAKKFSRSYLAPAADFNAAVCYENLGKIDDAISSYKNIVDKYGKTCPQTPHALFSLGRLTEQKGDSKAAAEFYTKLTNDYPDTNWSGLGSNRLIYLAAEGEITR